MVQSYGLIWHWGYAVLPGSGVLMQMLSTLMGMGWLLLSLNWVVHVVGAPAASDRDLQECAPLNACACRWVVWRGGACWYWCGFWSLALINRVQ